MGKLTISNIGLVLPPNFIDGLILSNGTDTDHDIDIATGFCTPKDEMLGIQLSSVLTKQIDANWVEGNNAGGFPSGISIATDTWYHIFVISNDDGSLVDAGFDTSLTAANLLANATNYSKYRRIGSVLTDASSNIVDFIDTEISGGSVYREWNTMIQDVNETPPNTTRQLITITVPINTIASISCAIDASTSLYFIATNTALDDIAAGINNFILSANVDSTTAQTILNVIVDSSNQIAYRVSAVSGVTVVINTLGYTDTRVS